jgi:hypothetical protein
VDDYANGLGGGLCKSYPQFYHSLKASGFSHEPAYQVIFPGFKVWAFKFNFDRYSWASATPCFRTTACCWRRRSGGSAVQLECS